MKRQLGVALAAWLSSGCAVAVIGGRSAVAAFVNPPPAPKHPASLQLHHARLAATWLGHATVLLQLDDKLVLTDPLLSETAGYFSRRLVASPVRMSGLPPLDAVTISHMHFDHLSWDTLFAIKRRVHVLVMPTGGRAYVPEYGFPVDELAPFASRTEAGLTITAVPVRHVGWRWGVDALANPQTFTGYVVQKGGLTVYVGGDSALDLEDARKVHQKFPHIDLAVLPIGPIEPRYFMERTHMDPGEAVQTFEALGADVLLPVHYDTFINSYDDVGVALPTLERAFAAYAARGGQGRLLALPLGGQETLLASPTPVVFTSRR
jgi:L-ascorbate metabolism protein UlaG (beta-lactamase superfamily)